MGGRLTLAWRAIFATGNLAAENDDLRALNVFSSAVAVSDDGEQPLTFNAGQRKHADAPGHRPRLALPPRSVFLLFASVR